MPVKSSGKNTTKTPVSPTSPASSPPARPSAIADHDFAKKILLTLLGVLLVYVIIFIGALIRNTLREYTTIGYADKVERTLRLEATGKVTAQPDIAKTTIGIISEGETVSEAQQANSTVMNALIERLKSMGIAQEDLQTANYNIYPQYNYTQSEGRTLEGYEVSQNVTVKIRDLSKANDVLALAGELGANSVSGLEFTIDDQEVYVAQAREEALELLSQKANALAESLDIRLVSIISYDEFPVTPDHPVYARTLGLEGYGGTTPQVESGSMDVVVNISIVFEMR